MKQFLILAVAIGQSWAMAAAGRGADFDMSELRSLPVFPGDRFVRTWPKEFRPGQLGRPMPLDSYARQIVRKLTHVERPTLMLKGAVTDEEFNSPEFAAARKLFPDDKPRTFDAVELLVSWLVEPETWEVIPCIFAGHEDLRGEVLGLPTHADGERLKYVSPRQWRTSEKFKQWRKDFSARMEAAQAREEQYEGTDLEKKVVDLSNAMGVFDQITFDPRRPRPTDQRSRFKQHFQQAAKVWGTYGQFFKQYADETTSQDKPQLQQMLTTIGDSLRSLVQAWDHQELTLEKAQPLLATLCQAADQWAVRMDDDYRREFPKGRAAPDEKLSAAESDRRRDITFRAGGAAEFAKYAREMQYAFYDDGGALPVVPALHSAALERERNVDDQIQPWLDIKTLRFAPPEGLVGYPPALVKRVREDFDGLVKAYTNRDNANRAAEVELSIRSLMASLRELGEAIEPARRELRGRDIDQHLLAYTAYPAGANMAREVRYNRVDPFKWSWVLALGSVMFFALSFGSVRKPMFWVAMGVAGCALAWTVYGLYLRVMISQWAPVTNMYTTMIWVPFVVLALGMWFAVLPVTWPAIRQGWRLNAIPGTWESAGASAEDAPPAPGLVSLVMLVPRVLLMALVFWVLAIAPYSAGDRPIINLQPNYDAAYLSGKTSSTPWLTWAVGIAVLVPAVWYLPRVALALAVAPATVFGATAGRSRELFAQVYARKAFVMMAAIGGVVGWLIAWFGADDGTVLNEDFSPLMPVLRDNFWLTIHVLTIVSSYGAGLLAWLLGLLALGYYLCGQYRQPATSRLTAERLAAREADAVDDGEEHAGFALARRPPDACATLAGYLYKAVQVAVLLLAAGTILGGLWADVSWGRFWGWDSKEVWALISLLVYLAILHGRYAGWFGNFGLVAGSQLGAWAIIWAWYGMNFLLPGGLHAYGGGEGTAGKLWVLAGFIANSVFLGAASLRYWVEMEGKGVKNQESGERGRGSGGGGQAEARKKELAPVVSAAADGE